MLCSIFFMEPSTEGGYFSNFENLYLDIPTHTFFYVGNDKKITESINRKENRGYKWKGYSHKVFRAIYEKKKNIYHISGTTIVVLERKSTENHTTHYFHFLEHLLGIWNFGGEVAHNDVSLVILAGNGKNSMVNWQVGSTPTYHLIKALFPNAEIKTWDDVLQQNRGQVLCFEKAIVSDRAMETFKIEPYHTERMLGGYFKNLKKDSLNRLKGHIWNYCEVTKDVSKKTVVTYVQRANSRRLSPDCDTELIQKINKLPIVELRIVDFAAIPFKEQVNIVANTDILLGVHGNGLSHTLLLPQGAALIELFPKKSFRVEYRILALARGLAYYGWIESEGWISDETEETVGCHGEISVEELDTDVDAIIEKINLWIYKKQFN